MTVRVRAMIPEGVKALAIGCHAAGNSTEDTEGFLSWWVKVSWAVFTETNLLAIYSAGHTLHLFQRLIYQT